VSLSAHLKQVGISEGCAETEDVVSFWVFWYGLHDGTINDNEVFGGRLDGAPLSGITWIEEEGCALQTHPVTLPASLTCQLYLVLLPKQPLLDTQESTTD